MRNGYPGAGLAERVGDRASGGAANEDRRIAVVNDVGRFLRREIAIDAGEVEAASVSRPGHLEEAQIVFHEQRDMVSNAKALSLEIVGQLRRTGIEGGVVEHLSGVGVDGCRFVRRNGSPVSWIHSGSSLPKVAPSLRLWARAV